MLLQYLKPSPNSLDTFGRRVVLPVTLLVAGAMTLCLTFALISSSRQDSLAIDASTRLARTALLVKQREMARNLKDYAVWEDAYNHLHVKLDLDWASTDGNVGANIYNSLGYDMAFVVAPSGTTVYAVLGGVSQKAEAPALIPDVTKLIRRAESETEPVVGLLRSGSDVAMVAATAILPPAGSATPPAPGARSILVFAKSIDQSFLTAMSEQYLLDKLALVSGAAPDAPALLPLVTPDGTTIGSLTWQPETPGRDLLRVLLPPLGAALLGIAAFGFLVLRNVRRSALTIAASAKTIEAYAQTLEKSEARFRDVAEASSDWIWETDPELRFTYLSIRFGEVTGVSAATILGKTLETFFSSDALSNGWSTLVGDAERHQTFRDLRCAYRDAAGANRICRIAGRPILSNSGEFLGYRGTATDITSEVEAHAKANYLALHDALTELPNRVLLRERLNNALAGVERDGTQVAVLCVDLDHFKDVNDTLGHGAGDLILRQVAERLRASVRGQDTVARMGGDEFAVLQVGMSQPAEANALCRRMIEALAAPFRVEDRDFFVGASVGIALAPGDADDQERLLKNADIALYRAKQAGRGTFRFFEHTMDSELQERKLIEQDLRHALARGELELHYQPLVMIDTYELAGVEALMRWHHPTRGTISPSEFIPIAEETGLIIPLGEWALRRACYQVKEWDGLRVAVNLSPVQFKHRELINSIKSVLEETGLEPSRLELEITESVLLYDAKAALEVLNALKGLGVRIAMDDFGTGYSSLGYLNSFPFDKIKIDRSFITDLNEKDKSDAIVRSVISLGQSLKMVTTAEGVETLEQLTFLASEGCEQVQGYYFGRPTKPQEITALIAAWHHVRKSAA